MTRHLYRDHESLRTQAVYTAQQSNLSNAASKALQDYRRAKARLTRAKAREAVSVALRCLSVGLGLVVIAYGYLVALDWAVCNVRGLC